jgi:hypothetical protein
MTLLGLSIAALALVPAAALGSALSNTKTYKDSIGEDAQAPDVSSVVISNDDARLIKFRINIRNRPSLTSDMTILAFVDADRKESTGDPDTLGADYAIELDPGSVTLFKWTGSDYTFASDQSTLKYSYDSKGATIRVNASDLGDTKAFRFAVVAVSGITTDANGESDFSNAHRDYVPDAGDGFASFKIVAKLSLKATAFSVSPTPAKVGKRLSVSLAAEESDTNAPVGRGTVTCVGKVGGKAVRAAHSLAYGVATCNWLLPRSAKGKRFHGTLTLTVQGTKLVKSFASIVR